MNRPLSSKALLAVGVAAMFGGEYFFDFSRPKPKQKEGKVIGPEDLARIEKARLRRERKALRKKP